MSSEDKSSSKKTLEKEVEPVVEKEVEPQKFLGVEEIPNYDKANNKSTPSGMIVALIVVVGVAGFFAGSYFSNLDSDALTKSDLETAISNLESKIQAAPAPTPTPTEAAPQPTQPVNISIDDDPIRGDPNAPITIIEFSDFQCPFCARFHVQTLPSLLNQYIDEGKVNFVYRDFPLQSIHPNALPAHVAAECANEQGKYWEYHDILFEKQDGWNRLDPDTLISTLSQYATDVGVEQEQFDTCLETGKYLEEVQKDLNDGREYGITGTPGFFIGNEETGFVKLSGAQPFSSFQTIIDGKLDT